MKSHTCAHVYARQHPAACRTQRRQPLLKARRDVLRLGPGDLHSFPIERGTGSATQGCNQHGDHYNYDETQAGYACVTCGAHTCARAPDVWNACAYSLSRHLPSVRSRTL